jgi:HlyD family secretion protein
VLARSGSLPGVVNATGELDAVERVNVSPRRQGVIEQLFVDEGDAVRTGQVLARMDPGDLGDREEELQANVRSAEAELRRSASERSRNEPLFRQGAISLNDLNRFRADEEVKQMALAAVRQRLDQRLVEQGELLVRAPFSGVISQRYADPGAFVTPTTTASATAGATSSSIVELSQGLEVLAKVPESDLGRLRPGMTATGYIRINAYKGRIRAPRAALLERDNRKLVFRLRGNRVEWIYVDPVVITSEHVVLNEAVFQPGDTLAVDRHFAVSHQQIVDVRLR